MKFKGPARNLVAVSDRTVLGSVVTQNGNPDGEVNVVTRLVGDERVCVTATQDEILALAASVVKDLPVGHFITAASNNPAAFAALESFVRVIRAGMNAAKPASAAVH